MTTLIIVLLIPFGFFGGVFYAIIADKVFKKREPWFTVSMLCGLGATVSGVTWFLGASLETAIWVFIGTGISYIALRLLFGRASGLETFCIVHLCAVLLLLLLPVLRMRERGRDRFMTYNLARPLVSKY